MVTQRFLLLLLLTTPFGLFAQGEQKILNNFLTADTADIRNNIWYYGTNSMNTPDEFLMWFNKKFVKESITRHVHTLTGENARIGQELADRGRNTLIPEALNQFMIICNETHGILFWWFDKDIMLRYFFTLKLSDR